jgi:hypothetical protein
MDGDFFKSTLESDILDAMENRAFSDVGGTTGGLGEFLLGFVMTCVGGISHHQPS